MKKVIFSLVFLCAVLSMQAQAQATVKKTTTVPKTQPTIPIENALNQNNGINDNKAISGGTPRTRVAPPPKPKKDIDKNALPARKGI